MAIIFLIEIMHHLNAKHEYNVLIHSSIKKEEVKSGVVFMLHGLLFDVPRQTMKLLR